MTQQVSVLHNSVTFDATREPDLVRVVERATLRTEPFDHVRLENVFPADLYDRMLENFPAV